MTVSEKAKKDDHDLVEQYAGVARGYSRLATDALETACCYDSLVVASGEPELTQSASSYRTISRLWKECERAWTAAHIAAKKAATKKWAKLGEDF